MSEIVKLFDSAQKAAEEREKMRQHDRIAFSSAVAEATRNDPTAKEQEEGRVEAVKRGITPPEPGDKDVMEHLTKQILDKQQKNLEKVAKRNAEFVAAAKKDGVNVPGMFRKDERGGDSPKNVDAPKPQPSSGGPAAPNPAPTPATPAT